VSCQYSFSVEFFFNLSSSGPEGELPWRDIGDEFLMGPALALVIAVKEIKLARELRRLA
jgi:hypothetical protein